MHEEIKNFIKGYKTFKNEYFGNQNHIYHDLVKYGQKPKVLVISCSDSRVDPAILMNCAPGDLFVIRNVANLIPPYESDQAHHGTSAALEFGICSLGIKDIIVLGHTDCGGISVMVEQGDQLLHQKEISFVSRWMQIAEPAYKETVKKCQHMELSDQVNECGKYALLNSFNNLKSFPWISDRMKDGRLEVHLWNFNLNNGMIEYYDYGLQCFCQLSDDTV